MILSISTSEARAVQVTSIYVQSTSICTCGNLPYGPYYNSTFLNYCPHCHHYGTLEYNPKDAKGGEWTCSNCGADYCAADGKEKIIGSHYYLTEYTIPTNILNILTHGGIQI